MTTCPTCNKPVDPLRARAVGVRDGKVVAFCSNECAGKAEAPRPAPARAATPARGAVVPKSIQDLDSGPVIEIIHEPASGVVTSARDERKPEDRTARDDDSEPSIEIKDAGAKDASGARTSEGRTLAELSGELGNKTPLVIAASKPARGSGTTKRSRKDSIDSKAGWDWIEDEPAENVRPGTASEQDVRTGARGVWIFLFVLVVLGGGGFAFYKLYWLPQQHAPASSRGPAASSVGSVATPTPPAGDEPLVVAADPAVADSSAPVPSPAELLERARDVLREHVQSASPRLQRVAAAALARTGDANAIAFLARTLVAETVKSKKLELAYQLARAGDKRGYDHLVGGLRAARRDDKLDAARYLAMLGDERAVPLLAGYLEVSQHRLSAAEQLARLAEPRAIKVLEQIRTDEESTADDVARATIALGHAGSKSRPDVAVAAELRALLEDARHNTFAAAALAALHDEAARPVLVRQLGVPSLRVGAARALRQLDPERDLREVTPIEALESEQDFDQIQAAEAILLLLGASSLAEHA